MLDLDRKVLGYNVIIKLDMLKAYDRLEWDFIPYVLERFGFFDLVTYIIRRCLTSSWFSVMVNGEMCGLSDNV